MRRGGGHTFAVALLVLAAAVCLFLGLTQPVIRLTRLYFWEDTYSLSSAIFALYKGNEVFLAAVIFLFSIVLPAFKLIYIVAVAILANSNSLARRRWFRRIEWLGKWSMLDVLVLALLIFGAKASTLADAVTLPGIYFFAASVILTMVAYGLLREEDTDHFGR